MGRREPLGVQPPVGPGRTRPPRPARAPASGRARSAQPGQHGLVVVGPVQPVRRRPGRGRARAGLAGRAQRRLALGDPADTATRATSCCSGPTDTDHQWPSSAPASRSPRCRCRSPSRARLHERAGRADPAPPARVAPHADRADPSVVFNDYMNTLMGDPTTAKLLPLIDAAAGAGAEIFCIDAGWYDDGGDWWDSVGAWEPSTTRFPRRPRRGHRRNPRAAAWCPGSGSNPRWSACAARWRDSCPTRRSCSATASGSSSTAATTSTCGTRGAVAHLDEAVDRLVRTSASATSSSTTTSPRRRHRPGRRQRGSGAARSTTGRTSPGSTSVLDRHPGLIFENCASGRDARRTTRCCRGSRCSRPRDQQDFLRYPPIAAAAPLSRCCPSRRRTGRTRSPT